MPAQLVKCVRVKSVVNQDEVVHSWSIFVVRKLLRTAKLETNHGIYELQLDRGFVLAGEIMGPAPVMHKCYIVPSCQVTLQDTLQKLQHSPNPFFYYNIHEKDISPSSKLWNHEKVHFVIRIGLPYLRT